MLFCVCFESVRLWNFNEVRKRYDEWAERQKKIINRSTHRAAQKSMLQSAFGHVVTLSAYVIAAIIVIIVGHNSCWVQGKRRAEVEAFHMCPIAKCLFNFIASQDVHSAAKAILLFYLSINCALFSLARTTRKSFSFECTLCERSFKLPFLAGIKVAFSTRQTTTSSGFVAHMFACTFRKY